MIPTTMQEAYEDAISHIQTETDRRMVMYWETVADSISFYMIQQGVSA